MAAPCLAAAAPVTLTVTTCGVDDDAVNDGASPSGSTNAPDRSTFTVSSGAVRLGRVPAGAGGRFIGTWVTSATIENWSAATLRFPASSSAAPAAMSTVTAPEAAGVIVAL